MSTGIYKIENLVNHKSYIGQSIHIEKRWDEHCRKSSKDSLIHKAIQKYGKENFTFQILEETDDILSLDELETKYILQFNSLVPNGYNIMINDKNYHHQFNYYDFEVFKKIVEDIKNSDLTFPQIAEKYELDLSMIYYLNRGDYHTDPNETYPLRQVKNTKKILHYCSDCGCEISRKATKCVSCSHKDQYRTLHPSRDELKVLIRSLSFTKIGEKFNVSDNAVRKWCKKENLPFKSSEIKKYTDEQWEKI